MSSDIKLDGNEVIVEGDTLVSRCKSMLLESGVILAQGNQLIIGGNQLKTDCWDLILDNPNNRDKLKGSPLSRIALSHAYGDVLVLNWNRSYKGIQIIGDTLIDGVISSPTGKTQINGELEASGLTIHDRGSAETSALRIIKPIGSSMTGGGYRAIDINNDNIRIVSRGRRTSNDRFPKERVELDLIGLQERVEALEKEIKEIKGQDNWRYCMNCKGLFFAGAEDNGVCPAAVDKGPHVNINSGNYVLRYD